MSNAAMTRYPSLVIYGGSFDPPHQGHVDCLTQVLEYFTHAKVMITPSLQPAGAGGSHKAPYVSYKQRLEMCRRAFGDAQWQPRVSISAIEESLPTPNFTVTTVEAIHKQNPDSRLALLMGQDQFISFSQWHEPLAILEQADLIVMRRDSTEHGYRGKLSENARSLATELGLSLTWNTTHTTAEIEEKNHSIFLVNEQISLAESGLIRNFMGAAQPLPDGWLPDAVAEFIAENSLYC